MKNKVKQAFSSHCNSLDYSSKTNVHYGVVEGDVGLMLCNAYFYLAYKDEKFMDSCYSLIENLLAKHKVDYSLGYGLTGLAWTVNLFNVNGLLEADAETWLKNVDCLLEEKCLHLIQKRNFDYFSGSLGLLNYFLCRQQNSLLEKVNRLVNSFLNEIKEISEEGLFSYKETLTPGGTTVQLLNLGVPHGVTGIILFLLKLKKTGRDVDYILHPLLEKLWSFQNIDSKPYQFSSFMGDIERGSHLAWCYGDLPILYLFEIITREDSYEKYRKGLDYLYKKTIVRTDYHKDNLTLCHGLPVIVYFFYKLKSIDTKYEKTYNYWKHQMDILYRQYQIDHSDIMRREYWSDFSLFNGFSGYFLVNLTINGYCPDNWDSILLI